MIRCVALLVAGLLCAAVAAPTPARAQPEERPTLVKSAKADLNGDGKTEAVAIRVRGADEIKGAEPVSFTLTVGGATIAGRFADYMEGCNGFYVTRIDGESRIRQIAVVGWASNDYAQTLLFEYNGKALKRIGNLEAEAEIKGNGAVYIWRRMGFWLALEKYAQDARTRQLVLVPQSAYYVGVPTKVVSPFVIRRDHTETASVVGTVAPGSEIQLLLYWHGPGPKKGIHQMDNGWYLIKTAKGLVGWARFGAFEKKVSDLPWAG